MDHAHMKARTGRDDCWRGEAITRLGGAGSPLLRAGFEVVGWGARTRARGLPDRERLDGRCQRGLRWEYRAATMNWDLRHRKSSLVIRLLLAVWITVVVVVLCATGRWWGLVFVLPLVLDLYLLRRILAAGSGW